MESLALNDNNIKLEEIRCLKKNKFFNIKNLFPKLNSISIHKDIDEIINKLNIGNNNEYENINILILYILAT